MYVVHLFTKHRLRDFNCILNPRIDRLSSSTKEPRTASHNAIHGFITDLELIDIYRERNPSLPGVIWAQPHNGIAERLDMFLISSDLRLEVTAVSTKATTFSDHHSVLLSLRSQNLTKHRGPGYWKFDVAFLQEDRFRLKITSLWKDWQKEERFPNTLERWDAGNVHVRTCSIRYGIASKRRHQKHR